MTLDEFNRLRAELNEKCEDLLDCKGADYTDGKDRLHNFKAIAEEAGITPLQAWHVYAYKHWKSICNYVKNGQVQSEKIEGRFQDLRNYLDLGYALLREAERLAQDSAAGIKLVKESPTIKEPVRKVEWILDQKDSPPDPNAPGKILRELAVEKVGDGRGYAIQREQNR